VVYLLVALCALAVRFGFWSQIRGTPLDEWHQWDQSDMATYVEQARRLADGDWLARDPYHPYHAWQREAASEENWLRWYGAQSFHQAPLYSYGLAALSKVSGDPIALAKALQLLLGAGTCVLIAQLAGLLGGTAAALVAGLVAANYGPLYYLEAQLLREGPAVFGYLAIVLAAIRHASLPGVTKSRRLALSAGVLGLAIGVYALFYETASVLIVAAAAVVCVHGLRRTRRPALALAALFAGCALGYAPLVARNVAIGAPWSTGSSRLGINLAYCNMSSAADGGATFRPPGPQFKQIMDASGGSTLAIAREVWRGYEGERARLFANWAHRFRALWAANEMPDNTSFRFYRLHSSVLRASFWFPWIFPAAGALCAVWIAARVRARGAEAEPERFQLAPWLESRAAAHATLLAFTLLLVLAMTVVPPQARYRLFLVPAFIVYTSLALVGAARLAASRQLAGAAGLAAAAAAFAALHVWVSAPRVHSDERFVDYSITASIYQRRGNEEAAAEYLRRRVITPGS
jgi:hypothetical protein